MTKQDIYTVGGTVQAGHGLYIPRKADDELLALCREGSFAYVLTPRQLGKSSLMVRTANRLQDEGVRSAIIDLTEIGVQVKPEEWYLGLLSTIEEQLDLQADVVSWWRQREHLGFTQRLTKFFEEVLLHEVDAPVVVFVDEIDTTLSLGFTDDFFAAIRYFYNARALSKNVRRLSFVLIGVATPGDLIRDPQRTPFNIGQRVELTDFTLEEALPLAAGLVLPEKEARKALGWVLKWTGGHPYLTQRLCRAIASRGQTNLTETDIDGVVASTFFGERSKQDDNLRFVRDMLTERVPAAVDVADLLTTYRDVRRGRRVPDAEQSLVKSHLKLSGIIRREDGLLRVRNPIYAKVFGTSWTKEHLPVNWGRLLLRTAAVLIGLVLVSLLPLSVYAFKRAREAERQGAEAVRQGEEAMRQSTIAQQQKGIAEEQRREADKQRQKAEAAADQERRAREQEQVQRLRAQAATTAAQKERDRATRLAADAEEQRQRAEVLSKIATSGQVGALAEITRNQRAGLLQKSVMLARAAVRQSLPSPSLIGYRALSQAMALLPQPLVSSLTDTKITSINFSNDGNNIVTASSEGEQWPRGYYYTQVFDSTGRSENVNLRNRFSNSNTRIDQSGKYALSVAQNNVLVIDLLTGRRSAPIPAKSAWGSENISIGGERIATIISDRSIEIRDWSGKIQRTINNEDDAFPNVSVWLSPNGRLVAFRRYGTQAYRTQAISDKTEVRDVATGDMIATTDKGSSSAPVAFNEDGRFFALGTDPNALALWETANRKQLWTASLPRRVFTLSFSPNGDRLAAATSDAVSILNVANGFELARLQVDEGVGKIVFSTSGKYIAVRTLENTVRVWEGSSMKEVARAVHEASVADLDFTPDEKVLFTVEQDKGVRMWDLSGEYSSHRTIKPAAREAVISTDQKYLFILNEDSIEVWSTEGFREAVRKLDVRKYDKGALSFNGKFLALGHAGDDGYSEVIVSDLLGNRQTTKLLKVTAGGPLAVSSDGNIVAITEARQDIVKVFELSSEKELAAIPESHGTYVLGFSPDGSLLVAGDRGKQAVVWDLHKNKIVTRFNHGGHQINFLFSSRGSYLATASENVQLWKPGVESPVILGKSSVILSSSVLGIRGLAFSDDERYVAAGGDDGIARVWETASGNLLAQFQHDGAVLSVSLSKSGEYLGAVVNGNSARIWNLRNKVEMARIPHRSTVTSDSVMVFVKEDKYVLTARENGDAEMWLWQPEDLLKRSCSLLTVNNLVESDLQDLDFRIRKNVLDELQKWRCPER